MVLPRRRRTVVGELGTAIVTCEDRGLVARRLRAVSLGPDGCRGQVDAPATTTSRKKRCIRLSAVSSGWKEVTSTRSLRHATG